jgi:hypothetical protein
MIHLCHRLSKGSRNYYDESNGTDCTQYHYIGLSIERL